MGETFLISRVDSIGDVILTLPLCGYLKEYKPGCRIIFLCRHYTKPVVECCEHVDDILIWDTLSAKAGRQAIETLKRLAINTVIHVFPHKRIAELCKKAGIKRRVGSSHRLWHWFTVNTLVHFSRRGSDLHEAQLNLKLISYIIGNHTPTLQDVFRHLGFTKIPALKEEYKRLLNSDKCNIILHPKSQGSAREWPLEKFAALAHNLPQERFRFFISGTEKEKPYADQLAAQCVGDVVNIAGMMSLTDFIAFISHADALIAGSTGPLHIAAVCGIHALGLYPPMRPIHPGRWAPLGQHVHIFCLNKICNDCRKGGPCRCMADLSVADVADCLRKLAQ